MAVHRLVEHWLSRNISRHSNVPRASVLSKLRPMVRNDMFAGGGPFESQPQYLLSWLTFFGVLSLLSNKCNHVTQASCHIVSTRWLTSTKHSTLIVWVTGSDFKWSINKQMNNWRAPALTCAASRLLPCFALPFINDLQPTQQKRNIPRNEPMAKGNDGEPNEEKTDRRHGRDRREYKKKIKNMRNK